MNEIDIYSEDGDTISLEDDNVYKTKYLAFKYKPVGTKYYLEFQYNGTNYKGEINGMLGNSQKTFMTLFYSSNCSSSVIDIAKSKIGRLILERKLKAADFVQELGADVIKRIHYYSIRFMFKCFDRALDMYRRNVMDYFLEVRRTKENDLGDNTVEFFLLTKIAHMVVHSNFECSLQINMIDQTDW
jgi:hypothetical protein